MGAASLAKRTARYGGVGAVCAVANNVLMIGGDRIHIGYVPMSLVSFSLVTPLGYLLHCRFTFREQPRWTAFLRFASSLAAGFPLYFLLLAIFCSGLALPVVIAVPLVTVLLYIWNYVMAHWAILPR